jgi:hypothetical protein
MKITTGPIHKLKAVKRSINSREIRPQARHKNPEHMYLNS